MESGIEVLEEGEQVRIVIPLRARGLGRGRVWVVGILLRSGRRVELATGRHQPVAAFKEILEREFGIVKEGARR